MKLVKLRADPKEGNKLTWNVVISLVRNTVFEMWAVFGSDIRADFPAGDAKFSWLRARVCTAKAPRNTAEY